MSCISENNQNHHVMNLSEIVTANKKINLQKKKYSQIYLLAEHMKLYHTVDICWWWKNSYTTKDDEYLYYPRLPHSLNIEFF